MDSPHHLGRMRRRNTIGSLDNVVLPKLPPVTLSPRPSPTKQTRVQLQKSVPMGSPVKRTGSPGPRRGGSSYWSSSARRSSAGSSYWSSVATRSPSYGRGRSNSRSALRADVHIEEGLLWEAVEAVQADGRPNQMTVTNFGKSRTARGAHITSVEHAKQEVSKRALRESALASDTLYKAQRMPVSPSLDPIDRAITLSLHQEDIDRSAPLQLLTQHERLKRHLTKVLKDPWRLGLFKTFLQQEQRDALVTFYEDIQRFKGEALSDSIHRKGDRELKDMASCLCLRYVQHESFPADFKDTLKETIIPATKETTPISSTLFQALERKLFSLLLADAFPRFFVSSSVFRTEKMGHVYQQDVPSFERDLSTGTDETSTAMEETLSFTMQETYTETESEFDDMDDAERWEEGKDRVFDAPMTPEHIIFHPDSGVVDAATVPMLIQYLTDPKTADQSLQFVFVLTFQYVVKPHVLMDLLHLRLSQVIQPPLDIFGGVEMVEWREQAMMPTLLRVLNLVKMLADLHPMRIRNTDDFSEGIYKLIDAVSLIHAKGADNLRSHLEKQVKGVAAGPVERAAQFSRQLPKVKLPRAFFECHLVTDLDLSCLTPVEIARQLTLLDHRLYRAIRPEELLLQNWTKEETKELYSSNVLASIRHFCNIGNWVVVEIVSKKELEKRSSALAMFIKAASECLKLQNFNGAMAIISGLQNHSVYRLTATWESLPSSVWSVWEAITERLKCDNNYSNLRQILKSTSPPCVPYLGMYLSELTFISNESNWAQQSRRLVNVVKMRFIANIVLAVQTFQNTRYELEPVDMIQTYLQQFHEATEDDLYKMSLECEERKGTLVEPMSKRKKKLKKKEQKKEKEKKSRRRLKASSSASSEEPKKNKLKASKILRASTSLQSRLKPRSSSNA